MHGVKSSAGGRATVMFLAWNITAPAAIGSVPIVALMANDPPPYAAWDSSGWLMLMMMPVTGLAAGLLGLRRSSMFLAVTGSYWVAQSLTGWLATCSDIGSSASCGPGAGAGGLLFAAGLAMVLGVTPLTVVYAIASRRRRLES